MAILTGIKDYGIREMQMLLEAKLDKEERRTFYWFAREINVDINFLDPFEENQMHFHYMWNAVMSSFSRRKYEFWK